MNKYVLITRYTVCAQHCFNMHGLTLKSMTKPTRPNAPNVLHLNTDKSWVCILMLFVTQNNFNHALQ